MNLKVSEQEILAAIEEATALEPTEDGSFSTDELCELLQWPVRRVRDAIRVLLKAGRLKIVPIRRVAMNGIVNTRPGYRVVSQKETTDEP